MHLQPVGVPQEPAASGGKISRVCRLEQKFLLWNGHTGKITEIVGAQFAAPALPKCSFSFRGALTMSIHPGHTKKTRISVVVCCGTLDVSMVACIHA